MPLLKFSILHHIIKINTSDELLFKPKFCKLLITFVKTRPDTNVIYKYLKKIEASNIDKERIENIISELINQKILENKKSVYGDSFRLITDKEKETLDETVSLDNIDNIENKDNQSDPGININPQLFTYRLENKFSLIFTNKRTRNKYRCSYSLTSTY